MKQPINGIIETGEVLCPQCIGSGVNKTRYTAEVCDVCNGTGQVPQQKQAKK